VVLRIGSLVTVLATVALGLGTVSCGADDATTAPGVVDVVASFYPLQYVAERVGGPYVTVHNLTPRGAEPHDLELEATDLAKVSRADLVLYLASFSPAVDDAVKTAGGRHSFDVGGTARVVPGDPHFWLDPERLADLADAVADRLAVLRPTAAAEFRTNAAALRSDLSALEMAYRDGLTRCASRDLVTSHAAFGYLASAYGLTQIGITGLNPDEEPSAAALAEVARIVRTKGVRTVYSETLVSPAIARTVASATGASVSVLDPLEGLAAGAAGAGGDYLSIMRVNLATLREGQRCT
jgi:zinc transport system substrate-binding protein